MSDLKVVDFRTRTGTQRETEQEQVASIKKALAEVSARKIVTLIENEDGELTFFNANNTPCDLLWAAKMIEIHALKKAGYE